MNRRDFLKLSSMTALLAAENGQDYRKSLPNFHRHLKAII
ncbi:twin-arginine translocation signal domain-containing protein [Parabacteroides merdae]|nr:twin-arginine translocation signal domain-containing protein [Parabacteroides merdae]